MPVSLTPDISTSSVVEPMASLQAQVKDLVSQMSRFQEQITHQHETIARLQYDLSIHRTVSRDLVHYMGSLVKEGVWPNKPGSGGLSTIQRLEAIENLIGANRTIAL